MEWHPIETAPEYVRVLVWSKREGVDIAKLIGGGSPMWWLCTDEGALNHCHDDGPGDPIEVDPTHWMPLPAPPRLTVSDESDMVFVSGALRLRRRPRLLCSRPARASRADRRLLSFRSMPWRPSAALGDDHISVV